MAFSQLRRMKWPLVIILLGLLGGVAGCSFLGQGFRPPVPTDLSATRGTFVDRVRLAWEPVTDAAGYEVWRGSTVDGDYARLGLSALPAYDDTAVNPGSTYWYKIRACNRAGCSSFTDPISGWARPTEIPSSPLGLTASQGTYADMILLTWQGSAGAQSYEVYRATSQTASYTLLTEVETDRYEDWDIERNVVYWYQVRACSSAGCSPPSTSVSGYASSTTLPVPENISASDGTEADKVVVSWDEVDAASSYLVYRGDSEAGPYVFKAEVETATWTDTAVEVGTTYWYKVRACTVSGCGPFSSADSGYGGEPSDTPPPPPTG